MVDLEAVVIAALRADGSVTALLGGDRIYTALPSAPEFPCIRVTQVAGGEDSLPWQATAPRREALTLQLDVWGGTRAQARAVADRARSALSEGLPGSVAGGAVAGVRWSSSAFIPDDDIPSSTGRARPRYILESSMVVSHLPDL